MVLRQTPSPLSLAPAETLSRVRYVLTDMDDTLTHQGRLPPETFIALDRLRLAGLRVVPVTAAPAGWCEQMARMWPVDAVIGENGGLYFHCDGNGAKRSVPDRVLCHPPAQAIEANERLKEAREMLFKQLPDPEVQKSYYYVDTGLIAGNVYLFAAAQGLAAWFHNCDTAGLAQRLGLRAEQRVLFAQSIGYPEKD